MPPDTEILAKLGQSVIDAINASKETGYKHDASGTPNAGYFHGNAGILSLPGLDPKIFSTIVGIEQGILGELNFIPSLATEPYFETLTGVQDDAGDRASTVCAECEKPGLLKGCTLTAPLGRYCRQTRELSVERLGEIVNRAEPLDLVLQNFLQPPESPLQPAGIPSASLALNREMVKQFIEFGVSISREMAQQVWVGNPTFNVGTGYAEFNGFDRLITTGHTDILTGTSCPSLDSDLKDMNYQLISATSPADIVQVMAAMVHYVKRNAETMGFMPVTWVFAMRPTLFHELSQLWPCRYSTFGCSVTNAATNQVQISGTEMVQERDRLRRLRVLPIEGVEIPVITDVGIEEETNGDNANIPAGQMASDIYLIPVRVQGGNTVTYMEYFKHDNPNAVEALQALHNTGVWFSNNGAWLWSNSRTLTCIKAQGTIRPRLILRTPQLAGRIQNVRYNPLQHERTPFPGDDTYFVDGGDTTETSWPITHAQ